MLYFFLLISFIINPYLLLLVNTSISKFKLPKIYSIIVIIYFFIFTNLRSHGEFLYTSTGDDSNDYTLGIVRVMNDYSIIDIKEKDLPEIAKELKKETLQHRNDTLWK